jgi:hypothetical protein
MAEASLGGERPVVHFDDIVTVFARVDVMA